MAKTRTQNHDDASSSTRKRFKTFEDEVVSSWSDLNHDVLFIIMMQLGVIDFLAFSGVCKSWRSFALPNKNMFMASMPPMSMQISFTDSHFHLEDFKGRRFKTILPHLAGRIFVGLSCGYLILFSREKRDFWVVNPITRHELHFPAIPIDVYTGNIKAILVHSPSIYGWVFVMVHRKISFSNPIEPNPIVSFSIAGKQGWDHVSSTHFIPSIIDLHAFKGKIYTLHTDRSLRELRPNLNQWTLFEINTLPEPNFFHAELVSSGENLYMIDRYSFLREVVELDTGKMKWVSPEKTIGEYAFFFSYLNYSAAIKPKSWAETPTQYKCYNHLLDDDKSRPHELYYRSTWYFPHDRLMVIS